MANAKIVLNKAGFTKLFQDNPKLKALFLEEAEKVKTAAEATANEAQNGPGGTLYGYAEAGFDVVWELRGDRPRVVIKSNADPEMALRVHFYTQKRDGISHLRAALASIT